MPIVNVRVKQLESLSIREVRIQRLHGAPDDGGDGLDHVVLNMLKRGKQGLVQFFSMAMMALAVRRI